MNRKTLFLYGLALAAFLSACAGGKKSLKDLATAGIDLVYNTPPGLSASYEVTTRSNIQQNIMGQEQAFETSSYQIFTLRAVKVEKDAIQFDVKFDSLHFQNPMFPSLEDFKKLLLRSSIRLFANRKGKVTNIEGIDELQRHPLGTNIQTQLKNILFVFPDQKVKTGDTWIIQDTSLVKSGGLDITVISHTTYRFAGMEQISGRECIKIVGDSQLKLSGAGTQSGMETLYEGTGTSHQIYYFDYAQGILVQASQEVNTDGLASLPSQGLDIATSTRQTTQTRLIK
jgi:hypothetical protein